MNGDIRGRVMIINIMNFYLTGQKREGSEVDYRNLRRMFKDLKFDIVKSQDQLTDLTAKVFNNLF